MGIHKNKSTRALVIILSALVVISVLISRHYYKGINDTVDPRIKKARLLYEKYNDYAKTSSFDSIFVLMDSIETIYSKYPHYRNSYEIGVLYNNRAASYLTMALHMDDSTATEGVRRDSLFSIAETMVLKSIAVYTAWLERFEDKNREEIRQNIETNFLNELELSSNASEKALINKRIEEIGEAQFETKRRLSVSYTNLGIIERYQMKYEEAAKHYKKALELWEQNLTAKNNLNLLLGRPLEKRNFIQKLFPVDREKTEQTSDN